MNINPLTKHIIVYFPNVQCYEWSAICNIVFILNDAAGVVFSSQAHVYLTLKKGVFE